MAEIKEVEWADLTLYIEGAKVTKVQGMKYGRDMEKEFLYGQGTAPFGIQSGNESFKGEMKLLKGAVDALNASARAAGGKSLLDVAVTAVVNYRFKGSRVQQTDTLVGLEWTGYEKGMEQNAKSMPITLPFMYLELIEV